MNLRFTPTKGQRFLFHGPDIGISVITAISTLTLVSDWFLLLSPSPIPAGRRVGTVQGWELEDAPSPVRKAECTNPTKFLPWQERTKHVALPFCAASIPIYCSKVSLLWPLRTDRNEPLFRLRHSTDSVQSNAVPGVWSINLTWLSVISWFASWQPLLVPHKADICEENK